MTRDHPQEDLEGFAQSTLNRAQKSLSMTYSTTVKNRLSSTYLFTLEISASIRRRQKDPRNWTLLFSQFYTELMKTCQWPIPPPIHHQEKATLF